MKKLLIALCLSVFASSALANIIHCPAHAICEKEACRLETVGTPWTDSDAAYVRDGVFSLAEASEGVGGNDNITYCVYHVPPVVPGGKFSNMFFIAHNHAYRAAINVAGNRWTTSSMNHGCRPVSGPQDCPFTSVPIVKK